MLSPSARAVASSPGSLGSGPGPDFGDQARFPRDAGEWPRASSPLPLRSRAPRPAGVARRPPRRPRSLPSRAPLAAGRTRGAPLRPRLARLDQRDGKLGPGDTSDEEQEHGKGERPEQACQGSPSQSTRLFRVRAARKAPQVFFGCPAALIPSAEPRKDEHPPAGSFGGQLATLGEVLVVVAERRAQIVRVVRLAPEQERRRSCRFRARKRERKVESTRWDTAVSPRNRAASARARRSFIEAEASTSFRPRRSAAWRIAR